MLLYFKLEHIKDYKIKGTLSIFRTIISSHLNKQYICKQRKKNNSVYVIVFPDSQTKHQIQNNSEVQEGVEQRRTRVRSMKWKWACTMERKRAWIMVQRWAWIAEQRWGLDCVAEVDLDRRAEDETMTEHRAKQMTGPKTRAETMVNEAKVEPTRPGTRVEPTEHGAKAEMARPRTRVELTKHGAEAEPAKPGTMAEPTEHGAKAKTTGPRTRVEQTEHGAKTETAGRRTREESTNHVARVETVRQGAWRVQRGPSCPWLDRHDWTGNYRVRRDFMDCFCGCDMDCDWANWLLRGSCSGHCHIWEMCAAHTHTESGDDYGSTKDNRMTSRITGLAITECRTSGLGSARTPDLGTMEAMAGKAWDI